MYGSSEFSVTPLGPTAQTGTIAAGGLAFAADLLFVFVVLLALAALFTALRELSVLARTTA